MVSKEIDPRVIVKIRIEGDGTGKTYIQEKLQKLLEEEDFGFQFIKHEHGFNATRPGYTGDTPDPVLTFIKARIRPDPEGIMTKEALYGSYWNWCIENKIPPFVQAAFSRRFVQHAANFIKIKTSRRNIDGRRVRCWDGIIDKTNNEHYDLSDTIIDKINFEEKNPNQCSER